MSDLHDYLTGLFNRKGMYDIWNRFSTECETIQIFFLDLDNFKAVNDIYGHKAGDLTLIRFGAMLRMLIPDDGAVIRLGGDEFVMVFPGKYERRDLEEYAQKLITWVRQEAGGNKYFQVISVSVGIVQNASVKEGIDHLLSYSDMAMYYAKTSGKNRYIFFDDYADQIRSEKEMESTAVRDLENGKFHVQYYPIIHLQNEKIVRTGAATVWERGHGTIWQRKDFEAVLDRIGYINYIERFTLEQVCKDMQSFQETGRKTVRVGIWLSQLLMEDEFIPYLKGLTDQYRVSLDQIELWVDEKMFNARNSESLIKRLMELSEAGIHIGLIGMGESFSSFPYIERIPFSTILFDRNYVDETIQIKTRDKILHILFQMTKELRFLSVVQGIDQIEKAEKLQECGCDAGCGLHFSKLMTATEYGEYLRKIVWREKAYYFAFQNSLQTTDGSYAGENIGEVQFVSGISDKWGGLRFPGGPVETNLIRLPMGAFAGNSYTVMMWVKPHEVQNWISAFFARHRKGFSSFMPSISGNLSMYRIHQDGMERWTDIMYSALPVGQWTHVALVYDSYGNSVRLFLNGELQGSMHDFPDVGSITLAYLGGDSYQASFRGDISALCIYDHPRTAEEISQSYRAYKEEAGFCGDEPPEDRVEYPVHDPAVYEDPRSHRFYLYCTGAQGWESDDLIHWKALGNILEDLPEDAKAWTGSEAVWAPDIVKVGEEYRLYCSNSSWGSQKSSIFLAVADKPQGPFRPVGAVLKTDETLDVNGIDANIIADHDTGEQYLLYGSFWGGIHLLPIDKETGFLRDGGTQGCGVGSLKLMPTWHGETFQELSEEELIRRRGICLARRPHWTSASIEGPYMIYHPETEYYYLFVSYGSLKSDYNIRVGRSRKVTGPFLDYHGRDLADPSDDTLETGLMISSGYRWITGMPYMGPGHNSVLLRENGEMFLVSHIRKMRLLDDDPGQGLLQVRRMFMTPDGWPIASSQPYEEETFRIARMPVIPGKYERIELRPSIPQGIAHAHAMTLFEDGRMECSSIVGSWKRVDEYSLLLEYGPIQEFVHVEKGLDTDRNRTTVILSGLTSQGICTWAKKE